MPCRHVPLLCALLRRGARDGPHANKAEGGELDNYTIHICMIYYKVHNLYYTCACVCVCLSLSLCRYIYIYIYIYIHTYLSISLSISLSLSLYIYIYIGPGRPAEVTSSRERSRALMPRGTPFDVGFCTSRPSNLLADAILLGRPAGHLKVN